jgi:serine/threonine protein kinase/Tfp pilus assembly protein PilF
MGLSISQMAQMSRLLDEALPLDAAGRRAWLEALSPEFQEIAPALQQALLPGAAQTADLEALATLPKLGSADEANAVAASGLQPGARVGPYELIRPLGAGGMAEVWLARRADGAFRREVALKLPRQMQHREQLTQRFALECDILASLEHALIARLYDAGIAENGRPYLAMEYVRGEVLTTWCDRQRLVVSARVELFLQILDAVQFAHSKRIIHRDLKPSNVLVTDSGQVRLLDFGVAKLLAGEQTDPAVGQLTGVYGRALTPDYASPELLRGDAVDVRSDIYSLGMLLYELLSGARAYQLKAAAAVGLLGHAAAAVEPCRPSERIEQAAAEARGASLRALKRALRGDLDAITLKALAKVPDGRYDNAAAMAEDLRRQLAGKPISARPPRPSRRSQRTAARPAAPTRVTICVLPFGNLSGDPEQEIFCDGFSQDIITELARWRLLEVRTRLASFKYRGTVIPIARLARELNVRFVVEGSVRRLGDRIRIAVQLIDVTTGQQVWGDRYDRDAAEIFSVQDEVAQKIVSTLVGRVQVTDADRARRKRPSSLEAYECVLRGNALPWDDPAGASEATQLFEKAIQIDPGYGMAYGLLAMMRVHAWSDQTGDSTAYLDEAYKLARRAVELDDSESTCHSMLAQVYMYRRAFEPALQHMRRSVELNPNNQWNLADMADVLGYAGEAEQALNWSDRANEVDPYFDPPWFWRQKGRCYAVLGRYQEALTMFERMPLHTYYDAAYMAACHARLENSDRARSLAAECLVSRPNFSIRRLLVIEPFKLSSDAENLAQSLRLAGLPE